MTGATLTYLVNNVTVIASITYGEVLVSVLLCVVSVLLIFGIVQRSL